MSAEILWIYRNKMRKQIIHCNILICAQNPIFIILINIILILLILVGINKSYIFYKFEFFFLFFTNAWINFSSFFSYRCFVSICPFCACLISIFRSMSENRYIDYSNDGNSLLFADSLCGLSQITEIKSFDFGRQEF